MSILVTGGTGFLGKLLVDKLLEKGEDIVIFSRNEDKELAGKGVKFVLGDIRNKDDLKKAFENVQVVYHLAAAIDSSDPNLYEINVNGTKNVVELCKRHNIKKLIFMSSCATLGDVKVANENSPYHPQSKYGQTKVEGEKIIINSGIQYTIIRAPMIIGNNEIWLKILKAAKKKFPIIGSGKNKFHNAYVDDVAELLAIAKDDEKSDGETFHVATKDVPTYEETYKIMAEELGTNVPKFHVPAFSMKLLSSITVSLLKNKTPLAFRKDSIGRLIRDRTISIAKAKAILNFVPKYDTRSAIRETIRRFKESDML